MSQQANFKILDSKGGFPTKLAAKSHRYIIKGNFDNTSFISKGINGFMKLSQTLMFEIEKLAFYKKSIHISLPSGISLKENFKKHNSINVMLEKLGKNIIMHPVSLTTNVVCQDDISTHPAQIQHNHCQHEYKCSDTLEQANPLEESKFLEQTGAFNKYQFWRHHIIGYNPYIESAVDVIEFAMNSSFRENAEFKDLINTASKCCEEYEEVSKQLAGRVAFSTKVIWNPRNLFCGPSAYDHKSKLEEDYLKKLPEPSYKLINDSYKALVKISNLANLMPWLKKGVGKIEVNNLTEEDKGNINDALYQVVDFLGFWQELLPENNSKYIFNHIAEFSPFVKGNQVKFNLVGLNICSKNCTT
jgi:hypothetical protein